jgi:hypothetical protein
MLSFPIIRIAYTSPFLHVCKFGFFFLLFPFFVIFSLSLFFFKFKFILFYFIPSFDFLNMLVNVGFFLQDNYYVERNIDF